jgi:hypothetical protein
MVLTNSQFPEITTFSSLIRFALELERAAINLYEGSTPKYPSIAALPLLSDVHQKRSQLLEQTRRQKLNEMILEPIHELNRDDYVVEIEQAESAPINELLKMAVNLEEKSAKFYSDSAKVAKSLLAESSRIFQKLAKENEDNKGRLTSISV